MTEQTGAKKPHKLEDDPLWREANELAEYFYGKLAEFPEEEKWHTASKLHNAAADFVFWMGLSLSNVSATGQEHDWAHARKYTGALKTMYRFAGRQHFIDLDPQIMVRLNKLLEQIDDRIEQGKAKSEAFQATESEKDLRPWLKKYQIWKEMSNEEEADA